jgi:hypothetical protein
VATRHKRGSSSQFLASSRAALGWAPVVSGRLAHLPGMESNNAPIDVIEPVLSMSELAARLADGVPPHVWIGRTEIRHFSFSTWCRRATLECSGVSCH